MKWDLRINSKNNVEPMMRGFFERIEKLSISDAPMEKIEIGNYRICKNDYIANKEKFDKYIAKCNE